MATTTRGITYPTSSDNIAPLESHFSALASSVDTAMARNISGRTATFSAPLTVGGTTTQVVVFDTPIPMAVSPVVVGNVSSESTDVSAYVVNFYGISSTGFGAKITRIFGTSADTTLRLNWIAKAE
jgi:hypothetical protein